jgi:hypothetical protein
VKVDAKKGELAFEKAGAAKVTAAERATATA